MAAQPLLCLRCLPLPLLLLPLPLQVSERAECVFHRVPVCSVAHSLRICVVPIVVQEGSMHTHAQRRIVTPTVRSAIVASTPSRPTDRMEVTERTKLASCDTTEQLLSLASQFLALDGLTRLCALLRSENDARKHVKQSQQHSNKLAAPWKSFSHCRSHPLLISFTFLPLYASSFEVFTTSAFQARNR